MRAWSVPTKVMLAGEYGVLAPGGRALALATTPRLSVTAVPTPGISVVRLEAAPGHPAREIVPDVVAAEPLPDLEPGDRLTAAVWATAVDAGVTRDAMVVDLRWDGSGDVDGWTPVGTSAAVAVGLALALTGGQRGAALRLAWAGHSRAQGGGSGYDIAACLVGGAVTFTSGAGALPTSMGEGPWPSAEAARLVPGLRIVEASTGKRAPTRDILARLEAARVRDPDGITNALAAHRDTSSGLVSALTGDDLGRVAASVEATAVTLEDLDARLGGVILADEIRTLVDVAAHAGVPARPSGAGGGDGVVAFAATDWLASRLRMRWIQAGVPARVLEPAPGPLEAP